MILKSDKDGNNAVFCWVCGSKIYSKDYIFQQIYQKIKPLWNCNLLANQDFFRNYSREYEPALNNSKGDDNAHPKFWLNEKTERMLVFRDKQSLKNQMILNPYECD